MLGLGAGLGLLSSSGCKLFDTNDAENSAGRGAKSFDPYSGAASGALRLGLQMYNGCAILANGEAVGKGNANIPYPATCERMPGQPPVPPTPPAPMPLQAGATYFLNQITLTEAALGLHTDPTNMGEVVDWMRTQTRFAPLDWTNLGITSDDYSASEESIGPNIYDHIVHFGNAAWQDIRNDTFLIEILNTDGVVVQNQLYDRADFFAENPTAGHTQIAWLNTNVGRPEFPGDLEIHPPPNPGVNFPPPSATAFRTRVRMDLILSTHPTKSFKLDAGLVGDGAVRLTWSQLPNAPFYFPVTFVRPQDLPASCFAGADGKTPVACDFGLQPEAKLAPPANGKFFVGGEQVKIRLAVKDGNGNYLHDPEKLPSFNQSYAGNANGIEYLSFPQIVNTGEKDSVGVLGMSGPHQLMKPSYNANDTTGYWAAPLSALGLEIAQSGSVPGAADVPIPTAQVITLPMNAKPGTYSVYFKIHRQFLGERFTKIGVSDFQVGQEEKTDFPGRVGNCQICHRGVLSLENVRHGLGVDYVEGCKTCHNANDGQFARIASQSIIHRVHMGSRKYTQDKNDCTFCHITKESATRPTYVVCASCHPQPHGTQFWDLQWQTDYDPKSIGVFTTCAEQCHVQTTPTGHILPSHE